MAMAQLTCSLLGHRACPTTPASIGAPLSSPGSWRSRHPISALLFFLDPGPQPRRGLSRGAVSSLPGGLHSGSAVSRSASRSDSLRKVVFVILPQHFLLVASSGLKPHFQYYVLLLIRCRSVCSSFVPCAAYTTHAFCRGTTTSVSSLLILRGLQSVLYMESLAMPRSCPQASTQGRNRRCVTG